MQTTNKISNLMPMEYLHKIIFLNIFKTVNIKYKIYVLLQGN